MIFNNNMTNNEIYEYCKTEEGCLDFIEKTIINNKGCCNYVYLPTEEIKSSVSY